MALKPVAVQGDVSAQAGSGLPSTASSGSWSPGSVSETSYPKLTVGGTAVIHQATCTFSFSGLDSSGQNSHPPFSSTVTLTAAATPLQGGASNVLRDGDEASDSYGNKLSVSASAKLKSEG